MVKVALTQVPAHVQRLAFTVTIHDAESRSQNFGMVSNAYIRIMNAASNEEIIRYDLGEDFSIETAIVVGKYTVITENGNLMRLVLATKVA